MPDGNDVQAHLADGTTLHFPMGTDPAVVSVAAKNHIAGSITQMPKGPVAPQTVPIGLAKNPSDLAYRQLQPESEFTKAARGAGLGLASGLGIPETQTPVTDLAKSAIHGMPDQLINALLPLRGLYQAGKGLGGSEWGDLKEATGRTPGADTESVAHGTVSSIVRPLMLVAGAKGGPEVADSSAEGARTGAQEALGVGKNFVKSGAEKVGEANADAVQKYQEGTADWQQNVRNKIQEAKTSSPQKFDEAEAEHQKNVQLAQQANKEAITGYKLRQQHLDAANAHAQTIADQLPTLYKAAKDEASAAYGPQPKGTFDGEELKTAIQDAAQSKLQGNTKLPAPVAKILSDIDKPPEPTLLDQASVFKGAGKGMRGQGKEYSASDALADMDPKARQKYLAGLSEPERAQLETPESTAPAAPLDAQRIHGFMSELGRAGASGSLAPDEASAVNATRSMLEGRLRKLYENEGRLDDFQNGQTKWKSMAQTFENARPAAAGGSPIAKALNTEDAVTGKLRPDYVRDALSSDKAYKLSQDLLDRYSHLNPPTDALEGMKTSLENAKRLGTGGKLKPIPETPDYPNVVKFGEFGKQPEPPTLEGYDPIEARKVALKQKSAALSGSGGPYGVMRDVMGMKGALTGNPMALSYPILRRILGSTVGSEGLTKWLAKATPEEMEMARKISLSKVAIKSKGKP